MSSYAIPGYKEFFQHPEQRAICGGMIENKDGSKMYVAKKVPIEEEDENKMKFDPNSPLTLWKALTVAASSLALAALGAWGVYVNLQGQISEVRSEVSTLRSDNREDFNRLNDKIDAIALRIDDKIDKASEKTDTKLEKITDALSDIKANSKK